MKTILQVLAASIILALVSDATLAQGLGKRPVRILVASPPGGPPIPRYACWCQK